MSKSNVNTIPSIAVIGSGYWENSKISFETGSTINDLHMLYNFF
jgi:hypothetical protein